MDVGRALVDRGDDGAVAGIGIQPGVVLLVLGWRLRHRRAGYAQVLQGGAVAVLYLTLFVAFGPAEGSRGRA